MEKGPIQTVDVQLKSARDHLTQLNCSKCEVIDPTISFLEGNAYSTFNRTTLLSYMDNDMHYTSAGIETLRPIFSFLISKLTL